MELEEFKALYGALNFLTVEDAAAGLYADHTLLLGVHRTLNFHLYYESGLLHVLHYTDTKEIVFYKSAKELAFEDCIPNGLVFPERSDAYVCRILLLRGQVLNFAPYNRTMLTPKAMVGSTYQEIAPKVLPTDIKTLKEAGYMHVEKGPDNLHLLMHEESGVESWWMASREYGPSGDGYPRIKWKNSLLNFMCLTKQTNGKEK